VEEKRVGRGINISLQLFAARELLAQIYRDATSWSMEEDG
jgi:hypothetical protein